MLFNKIEDGFAQIWMTKAEARSLCNALTIAKLHAGEDAILGANKDFVHVEHMREVLATAGEK